MIKKTFLIGLLIGFSTNIFSQKIMDAIRAKNYDAVKTLLEKGTNPNKHGKKGLLPLWLASFDNDTAILTLLIRFKANVNQLTDGEYPSAGLHMAAQEGNFNVVKVLVENGANVNILGPVNHSAIRIAARNGHLDIIKYLIEHGADADDKLGNDKATPLEAAAGKGHLEIVKYLVEKGANVNHQDKELDTAIGEAATKGFVDVVKYLLEKGANPLLKNEKGYDAIYRAKLGGQPLIVKLLNETVEKK
jgi:uncharacterized protein